MRDAPQVSFKSEIPNLIHVSKKESRAGKKTSSGREKVYLLAGRRAVEAYPTGVVAGTRQ